MICCICQFIYLLTWQYPWLLIIFIDPRSLMVHIPGSVDTGYTHHLRSWLGGVLPTYFDVE